MKLVDVDHHEANAIDDPLMLNYDSIRNQAFIKRRRQYVVEITPGLLNIIVSVLV